MGQRHQLFVIAKAHGRCRTLAALHQQWSYGTTAIERCQLVLLVLRANASIIRQEIQKAEKLDWAAEVEVEGVKESQKNLIFPIVTTCLVVAAGDKWLEPITILPTQCDNNDGITVFDITNPDQPRYAFVSLPDSEHDEDVERMTPMTATKYLHIYYQKGKGEAGEDEEGKNDPPPGSEEMAQEVSALPLIDAETLHSAWPSLHFEDNNKHSNTCIGTIDPAVGGDSEG